MYLLQVYIRVYSLGTLHSGIIFKGLYPLAITYLLLYDFVFEAAVFYYIK